MEEDLEKAGKKKHKDRACPTIFIIDKTEREAFKKYKNVWPFHKVLSKVRSRNKDLTTMGIGGR